MKVLNDNHKDIVVSVTIFLFGPYEYIDVSLDEFKSFKDSISYMKLLNDWHDDRMLQALFNKYGESQLVIVSTDNFYIEDYFESFSIDEEYFADDKTYKDAFKAACIAIDLFNDINKPKAKLKKQTKVQEPIIDICNMVPYSVSDSKNMGSDNW